MRAHLDLAFRPAAGPAVAGAGRHQSLQRGDGPAALCAGGDAAAQRHGAAPRQGQGGGLHARMGGEALRVDPRPPLPPGPRLHQGAVPPLRAGVRYRAARVPGRSAEGELRARMGAAHLDRPPVRRPAGGAGGRDASRSACCRPSPSPRASARRMFDLPPPELPDGARERAAALAADDRSQPLRQRPRPRAGRPCADRHGDRSLRISSPSCWRASSASRNAPPIEACLAAVRAGPSDHEVGPAVHQLPRRPSSAPARSPSCRAARIARPATSTTTATSSRTSSSPSRRRRRSGR